MIVEYNEILWEKDEDTVDKLIEEMSKCSSHYYFDEVAAVSLVGREYS